MIFILVNFVFISIARLWKNIFERIFLDIQILSLSLSFSFFFLFGTLGVFLISYSIDIMSGGDEDEFKRKDTRYRAD